jgi:hypothetical protein
MKLCGFSRMSQKENLGDFRHLRSVKQQRQLEESYFNLCPRLRELLHVLYKVYCIARVIEIRSQRPRWLGSAFQHLPVEDFEASFDNVNR